MGSSFGVGASFNATGTGMDFGARLNIRSGVRAEPEVGSGGTDGVDGRPAGGHPTGDLRRSLGPEGTPEGTGRVPKIDNMASLKASICCDVTGGSGNLWRNGASCGFSSSFGERDREAPGRPHDVSGWEW